MKKTVLVTGAAGFVGANLVRALLKRGYQTHIVVRQPKIAWRLRPLLNHPLIKLHPTNLLSRSAVRRMMHAVSPAIIYHLATKGAYHWQNDPEEIFQTNLLGTLNLLRASHDVDYSLFLNVGSSSEYGFSPKPMKESMTLQPNSYYAVAKAAQTLLASYEAQARHKPIVTVRLFTVYGPWEEGGKLIPTIFQHISATPAINESANKSTAAKSANNSTKSTHHPVSRPLPLADPKIAHDYIYIDDVVTGLLKISQLKKFGGEIFNFGTGRQTTLKQVISTIQQKTKKRIAAQWGAWPNHRWDQQRWVADMDKTQKLLHWKPTVDFATGTERMWAWWTANQVLYENET